MGVFQGGSGSTLCFFLKSTQLLVCCLTALSAALVNGGSDISQDVFRVSRQNA